MEQRPSSILLVTGATGYVGGELLRHLVSRSLPIRCLVRRPEALAGMGPSVEVVRGSLDDSASVREALRGVHTAFYLVHSMSASGDFAGRDRTAAAIFADAARGAGLRRIIYLGGLGHGTTLSPHLASRQETGGILRSSGVPVVEFRASVIVGAGSASFELARTLVDKLPILIAPRWVRTRTQPIALNDVIAYLLAALDADSPRGGIFEIGGADRVSYTGIMREYARQKGLRRLIVPVPVLSPKLSSIWLRLVAPRQAGIGRHLIEGVRNESIVQAGAPATVFPVRPRGASEAVRAAIEATPPERPALAGPKSAAAFALCVLACLGAGGLGTALSGDAIVTWYPQLQKPSWMPPAWIFAPVWTTLYVMMGIAAWLVWRRDGLREGRLSLGVFAIQLALNAAWSGLFFGLRSPGAAFADIVAIDIALGATILLFGARSVLAAVLLLPYAGWMALATALNFAIWRYNP